MKREREEGDNVEKDSNPVVTESLKETTIALTFDTLPLEEKRRLIPKLLKSARLVHGVFEGSIEAKFKTWLCKGKKKFVTEEEADKVWQIWGHIKSIACHAEVSESEEYRFDYAIYTTCRDVHGNEEMCGQFDVATVRHWDYDDWVFDDQEALSKDDYFEWLLDHTIPDQVLLIDDEGDWCYQFPEVTCHHRTCKCNMEPILMKELHGWDINRICPSKGE